MGPLLLRLAGAVVLAFSALQAGTAAAPIRAATADCRATIPNGHTPPGEHASRGHHGNGKLWTVLPLDGVLRFDAWASEPMKYGPKGRPGLHRDGSATTKVPWRGSRSAGARLKVRGRLLSGSAPRLHASIGSGTNAGSPHFWPSYLRFSKSGCWRITATAGKARLTFRLKVSIPAPPE
jgi:hypothetical protein